jgi:hypothetical protein
MVPTFAEAVVNGEVALKRLFDDAKNQENVHGGSLACLINR